MIHYRDHLRIVDLAWRWLSIICLYFDVVLTVLVTNVVVYLELGHFNISYCLCSITSPYMVIPKFMFASDQSFL